MQFNTVHYGSVWINIAQHYSVLLKFLSIAQQFCKICSVFLSMADFVLMRCSRLSIRLRLKLRWTIRWSYWGSLYPYYVETKKTEYIDGAGRSSVAQKLTKAWFFSLALLLICIPKSQPTKKAWFSPNAMHNSQASTHIHKHTTFTASHLFYVQTPSRNPTEKGYYSRILKRLRPQPHYEAVS